MATARTSRPPTGRVNTPLPTPIQSNRSVHFLFILCSLILNMCFMISWVRAEQIELAAPLQMAASQIHCQLLLGTRKLQFWVLIVLIYPLMKCFVVVIQKFFTLL